LNSALARTLYVIEFLIALIAVFTLWSQVGGQGHLDLMPWHLKFSLGVALAAATVKTTAAAASSDRVWNRRAVLWFVVLVLLGILAGLITYYYHVTEPPDDEESPQVALLSRQLVQP
jgi:hypothetical protein